MKNIMKSIIFYYGTPGWGWTMWGIGYKSDWFIGFSMRRVERHNFVGKDNPTVDGHDMDLAYACETINRLETRIAALQTENAELKWQVTGWKYNWNESTDREIELKRHIKRLCQAIAACTTDKGESQ